jgi:hypothetical protein
MSGYMEIGKNFDNATTYFYNSFDEGDWDDDDSIWNDDGWDDEDVDEDDYW